jgi:hypothetical protein
MEHLLRVTLDKSTRPWSVDIDQHDNANHIARDPHPQTIVWALQGNAADGQLQAPSWVDPPPDGIFGSPEVTPDGKHVHMTDLNDGPATQGDWIYRLSLVLDGQTYSTLDQLPPATNSNPSIKNN